MAPVLDFLDRVLGAAGLLVHRIVGDGLVGDLRFLIKSVDDRGHQIALLALSECDAPERPRTIGSGLGLAQDRPVAQPVAIEVVAIGELHVRVAIATGEPGLTNLRKGRVPLRAYEPYGVLEETQFVWGCALAILGGNPVRIHDPPAVGRVCGLVAAFLDGPNIVREAVLVDIYGKHVLARDRRHVGREEGAPRRVRVGRVKDAVGKPCVLVNREVGGGRRHARNIHIISEHVMDLAKAELALGSGLGIRRRVELGPRAPDG